MARARVTIELMSDNPMADDRLEVVVERYAATKKDGELDPLAYIDAAAKDAVHRAKAAAEASDVTYADALTQAKRPA